MAIYQLKSKKWKVEIWLKRRKIKTKIFLTKEHAQRFERAELISLESSRLGGAILKEYKYSELFSMWHEIAKQSKRTTSLVKDIQMHNDFINPIIGNQLTKEITSIQLNQIITLLKKKQMKSSSINKVIQLVKAVLNWAVREELISKNPASNLKQLKQDHKERDFWTHKDVSIFLNYTNTKYTGEKRWAHIFYLCLITTGMRLGEILGLTWNQIKFSDDSIHVTQMWGILEKKIIFSTKGKSDRIIPLQEILKKELLEFKKYHKHNLLFDSGTGCPIDANNFRKRYWHRDIIAAGIPTIRIHDARHTYATLFLEHAKDYLSLQKFMGHKSITTTQIYAHFDKDRISSFKNVIEVDYSSEIKDDGPQNVTPSNSPSGE